MATLQRDGFAGYRGPGRVVTAFTRVAGAKLFVSVDGGTGEEGVKVGLVGSDLVGAGFNFTTCDPITGQQTDSMVSWNGSSDLSKYRNGALMLEFLIPADAIVFAYMFADDAESENVLRSERRIPKPVGGENIIKAGMTTNEKPPVATWAETQPGGPALMI